MKVRIGQVLDSDGSGELEFEELCAEMKKLVRCPLQFASFFFSPGFLRVYSLFSSRFQRLDLDASAASGVVNLSQTILKGKGAWSSGICLVACTSKLPPSRRISTRRST